MVGWRGEEEGFGVGVWRWVGGLGLLQAGPRPQTCTWRSRRCCRRQWQHCSHHRPPGVCGRGWSGGMGSGWGLRRITDNLVCVPGGWGVGGLAGEEVGISDHNLALRFPPKPLSGTLPCAAAVGHASAHLCPCPQSTQVPTQAALERPLCVALVQHVGAHLCTQVPNRTATTLLSGTHLCVALVEHVGAAVNCAEARKGLQSRGSAAGRGKARRRGGPRVA